jgi:N utilization substance protein A
MLVALGKADIKTLEDLAYSATDDLAGWSERKDGETTRFEGALSSFELSRQEAEDIVMAARLKAGIVTEADLAKPAEAAPPEEETAAV